MNGVRLSFDVEGPQRDPHELYDRALAEQAVTDREAVPGCVQGVVRMPA